MPAPWHESCFTGGMDKPRTRALRRARHLLLALMGLWLFCAGGCAVLPIALTGASFAVPQAASLAMSGVKAAHKAGYVASDERDPGTIMRDNMLALKGQSALMNDPAAGEVHVYAFTGDLFATGLVDTHQERDRIIATLRAVQGTDEVKGLIRLRSEPKVYARMNDTALQNYVRMSLGSHLLHKNAQVEIDAVGGEVCIMGVVGTHAEALDLIQYVESITGARANSLLAIRDEYASLQSDTNRRYVLATSEELRQAALAPEPEPAQALPQGPVRYALVPLDQAYPGFYAQTGGTPAVHAAWNKTRLRLGQRLETLAKRERSEQARSELRTLAAQVTTDRDLSITDRLSVAHAQARDPHSRQAIKALLSVY